MIVYLVLYAISFGLSRFGFDIISGILLMAAAAWMYIRDVHKSENIIHLRGLFSMAWIGGQGISCLKLSHLQTAWKPETWLCFFLAYAGFWAVFEAMSYYIDDPDRGSREWHVVRGQERPLFHMIIAVTAISTVAFAFEALKLGYIPFILRGVPHAYSEFHVTGVHYFTVSCVLVPALSVIYFYLERGRDGGKALWVIGMNVVALLIPILCVSRFQLILAVGLCAFTYILLRGEMSIIYAVGILVLMIPAYILLTVARSHDVSYLNGIFEMRFQKMPIFITQPYMYIANNYDNFNCLVEQLPKHTFGLRMMFPVWALTGLKFLVPSLASFPIYVTKEELTTVTLFYDAFYDFGVVGVFLFSCILGAVSHMLMQMSKRFMNPVGYLFYAQIAMYLVLSFFTTWFSNPATWFYLVVTGMMYVYCGWKTHGR